MFYEKNGANMTEGNPIKLILQFAIPVFLGNLFQIFYGLIDTKIVGSTLGESALAAVGSVSILYNLLTGFFNGITLGFSVVSARHFGEGDMEKLKRSVAETILLGFIIAAIVITGVFVFLNSILSAMHVPTEQRKMAYAYISILVLGMFITLAYNMCANILRAIGDSMTPLIFLILAAVLNVILDYVCILVFSMGVGGAAVATVISQMVSVVLCVIHIKKNFPILQVKRRHFKLKKSEVTAMLSGGLSMGMMLSLVNLGTLILQAGINTLGTSVIVAHTAARKIFEIWGLPLTVLGSTMATYSGQNYGAGKYDRITSGLKISLILGCGWAVIILIMAYTISSPLVGFIASTNSKEILYWGSTYLKVDMIFEVVCVWIVLLRNTMQGIGDYRTPIISSLIEMACKIVFTMIFVKYFGYWAVIWTEPITWIIMVIPLIVMLIKNPVLHRKHTA